MGSTVIRYINNTNNDVVAGAHTVPKFDQLIVHEFIPALDALAGKTLQVLVDGVELTPDLVPANIVLETKPKELDKPEVEPKQPK